MKCPKCNIEYFDEKGVCPSCGNMLPVENTAPEVKEEPVENKEVNNEPVNSKPVSSEPPKKSPFLIIVIIILLVIVIVLGVLVYLNRTGKLDSILGNNETTNTVVDDNSTTNTDIKQDTYSYEEDPTQSKDDVISLYGMSFKLPEGFQYLFENEYYEVYNSTLKKVFILDNMYQGSSKDLEQGLSLIKAEYAQNGCKNIETKVSTSNDITYGLVTYTLDNQKIEEIYTLVNDKYIISFYNVETVLVSTEDFISYTTQIAKSGSTPASLAPSNEPDEVDFVRKTFEQDVI